MRPICYCNQHTSDQSASSGGVCFPSICSDRSVPPEDPNGEVHCAADSPMLEDPALVSSLARAVDRFPDPSASAQEPSERSLQPTTPSEDSSSSRLESIRRRHTSVGTSEQAAELLSTGWSKGANTAYQSGWQRWYSWCLSRQVDPIHCGIQPFLDFLTDMVLMDLQYRSINVVSTTHAPLEGSPIGQHPLVTQLFRGIYNSRPPEPRYTQTWDVNLLMVNHLRGPGNNVT